MNSGLLEEPSSNLETLLTAQVFAEYGNSVVLRRYGTTSLGQEYCIFARKRFLGGYQTHMVTANRRNRPFISPVFKVSGYQIFEEAIDFVNCLQRMLSQKSLFSLGLQPAGVCIPTGKEMLQLDEVPPNVHDYPDRNLQIGDEVYVECVLSGITFYHSGIYAGHGLVYHFMSNTQEVDSVLISALSTFGRTPAAVLLEPWYEFVHALTDVGETQPRIFRVSHPFRCRSPQQIVDECDRLRKEWDWYDIRNRNCQHFSSLCSTGVMVSYDMGNNLKYLACTLMRPTGLIAANRVNSC